MIRTKDSVEDLRKSRKRTQPTSSSTTPLDELKQMAKRCRTAESEPAAISQRNTKVNFALDKTVTFARVYDEEDLMNAWNSRAEAVMVKLGAQMTVQRYKQGGLNTTTDCIRGLEVHADAVRTEAKITRSHNFIYRILDQQQFLRSVMGKANEQILAKMSSVLSAEDVREAQDIASRDANAALVIHACDHAVRVQSCGKMPDNMFEDIASRMKGDDLASLLNESVINPACH